MKKKIENWKIVNGNIIPGNEGVDERIRVAGLEGSEERPHISDERQTQVTRWKRVLFLPQLGFIEPPIYILQDPFQGQQHTHKA